MEGFSSPEWRSYPAINMGGVSAWPPWLLANGLPLDSDALADANGDGVPLLLSYALDLDPRMQAGDQMPEAEITGEQMRMVFFAGREELTYAVETSLDLENWSIDGVSLSDPDADGRRTASVPIGAPQRFLRLVIRP